MAYTHELATNVAHSYNGGEALRQLKKSVLRRIRHTKNKLRYSRYQIAEGENTMGKTARKVLEAGAAHPVTAAGPVLDGIVTTGLGMTSPALGAAYLASPVGPTKLAIPVEAALQKMPGYKRATERMVKGVKESPRINKFLGTTPGQDITFDTSRSALRGMVQKGYSDRGGFYKIKRIK